MKTYITISDNIEVGVITEAQAMVDEVAFLLTIDEAKTLYKALGDAIEDTRPV